MSDEVRLSVQDRALWFAKYDTADRKKAAADGNALPDGSYIILDEDDLGNAIKAVGMGNANHDKIRRFIMARAKAMGKTAMIPDTWAGDGSLKS